MKRLAINGHTIELLLFDVFGTLVDWRGSLVKWFETYGRATNRSADWPGLVDAWRGAYQPSMDPIRQGRRPFVTLDVLHRESLDRLLAERGLADVSQEDRQAMVAAWHALNPWPDSAAGLARLKRVYVTATLSNGGVPLLVDLARHGGLVFDTILSADLFRQYKPAPSVYRGAVELLCRRPENAMMVAAHPSDLAAAAACGLRTARVFRPLEYGPGRTPPDEPSANWNVTAHDLLDMADRLGA